MSSLGKHTEVVRSEALAVTEVDGESVILNVDTGQYYGLNPVGAQLFSALDTPQSVGHLVEQVRAAHPDVSPSTIRDDVHAFLHRMIELGLVHVAIEDVS
jgi:predicted metal-dependent hydrolase